MVNLPIFVYKDEIVEAVKKYSVVVITAETGAGKSTQVPQYLLEAGYDLVVTQPRRLAARTVAQRVADERGEKLGGIIGYRTAVDRVDSPATRCLFCTDGLALVRELMRQNKADILILDEVHEWNENMEVLVAWAKRQIEEGADFKVVLMSATLEAEKLAEFFGGVPVISVPGRLFPVEERQPSSRLVDDVADLVREGRNVLVFQPGKQEIAETISALEQMGVDAEILPLHSELTPEEQAKCFKHYSRPKVVVSTNVAQTSVTIDDIDAVVDSGMERRIELVDGVEGLYLKPISLADSTQRKGRAGRTKAGVYIDHCPTADRPKFPVAEILRKRLDQTVLRLAIAGFDMEELEFFHQPNKEEIANARKSLVALGCMTEDGKVTKIGRLVNRLPVSVQYARMLVEADRLGVVDDILTVAAILEVGGITVPPPSRNRPDRPDWRQMVPDEHESDVMGQLAVWEMAKSMTKDEMFERGIALRKYFRAKEVRRHLAQAVKRFFRLNSTGRREDILKAVCAGMVDHLYHNEYGVYRNGENVSRELGTSSLVSGGEWLVALPFDLQIKTRRGMITLHLIQLASKVDPMWLAEVAPQLVHIEEGLNPYFDAEQDSCFSTTRTHFNGQMIKEERVATPKHERAAEIFADWLASQIQSGGDVPEALTSVVEHNRRRQEKACELNIRVGEEIFKIMSRSEWRDWLAERLKGARRVAEIKDFDILRLPELDPEMISKVLADNPDTVEIEGVTLQIEYGKDYYGQTYARTSVEEEFVRRTKAEAVVLPGGCVVEIRCGSHSAKTFKELVEKLEQERIERAWSEKRSQLEHASWISNPEEVFPYLPKLLSAVEITRTDNGEGEPIFGYLSLYSDSDPDFQIRLRESRKKAEEETKIGLRRLLKKACRDTLVVPKEEPWQTQSSGWYSSWSLTDLGNVLQTRYDQLVREYAECLTSSNIEEKIEALKVAAEAAKTEIGGEYEAIKQLRGIGN